MIAITDGLITTRTFGADYGYRDMNRVYAAMAAIAELLITCGFNIKITARVFTRNDFPSEAVFYEYIGHLRKLRDSIAVYITTPPTPPVDGTRPYLTVQEANDIEKILIDLEELITKMRLAYIHCGTRSCGQGGLII